MKCYLYFPITDSSNDVPNLSIFTNMMRQKTADGDLQSSGQGLDQEKKRTKIAN